jgi:hypothetical protein
MTPQDNGPLSVDEAAGLIGQAAIDEKQQPQPQDSAGAEPPNEAEETGEPETAISKDGAEASEREETEELPAIEAPRSWNAQGKARFAELPRDVQEVISTREAERETALSKAQQDTADIKRKAESEASSMGQYKAALDQLLPKAAEMFKNRWDNVDWGKVTDQLGAEEALKLKFQFEQEKEQLQRLDAAQRAAQTVQFRTYVTDEFEKLKTVSPELSDAKEGTARRQAVGKFLIENGIPENDVKGISAIALALAYDAMRYRQAQKNLATKQPAASAPPARSAVRPSAAKPQVAPQQQKAAQALERVTKSGSIDDYVAYLDARG